MLSSQQQLSKRGIQSDFRKPKITTIALSDEIEGVFIVALIDKITKATQDVVRGAKDLTDTARQNSLIADEQKQISNLYAQIGKLYHETHEPNSETPLGNLCLAVNASNERIAKYNEEIRKIRGTKRCPSCAADIPIASTFCGICGTKSESTVERTPQSETASKHCTGCGTELGDGLTFCTSCGKKQ